MSAATSATTASRLLSGTREPVRVSTNESLAELAGLQLIDGARLVAGDRVLVRAQADGRQNGIYVASAGKWFRAPDARDERAINRGVTVYVQDGAINAGRVYRFNTLDPNIGTDPIVLVAGEGGGGGGSGGPVALADVVGLPGALDAKQSRSERNQPGGYPGLDSNGKLLLTQLPASEGGIPSVADFPTRTAADETAIASGTLYLRTAGYASPGDGGGGLYTPSASEPTGAANGKFQSADGQWWKLAGKNRSVLAFGVKGDGVTDDTAAFQAMVAEGGLIVIPDNVTIRLTATIFVYQPVAIVGAGCVLHKALEESNRNVRGPGSWFFLDHLGVGLNFVGINAAAGTSGIAVQRMSGCGTYRNQPTPSGSTFTPLNASWDIQVTDLELQLDDFVFLNPTRALAAELSRGGRLRLNNIRGQPLLTGISIDKCYDVCWLDVHFWPFWSLHASVQNYTYANLQALVTGRVDGLLMQRFFCIYTNISWVVRDNGSGSLNRAHCDWAYLDNTAKGIVVDSNVNGASIHCNALTVYGRAASESIGVQMSGQNTRLTANFCDLEVFRNQAVYLDGSGNRMQAGILRIAGAAQAGGGTPAVFINSGNTLLIDGSKNFTSVGGQPFKGGAGTLVEGTGAAAAPPDPTLTVYNPTLGTSANITPNTQVSAFYYFKDGNQVTIHFDVTFGATPGAGGFSFTLPAGMTPATTSVGVTRNQSDGTQGQILVQGGNNRAFCYRYDNTHPFGANQRLSGTITYAIA